MIRKERERHGGGNGGIVRHQPRLIRLVVVRRDGKQTVTAGFLRLPGQRHGARGVVASRPGDHGNMPPRDALRLRPTAFLYREREQPELFLVGQRGRFPGRAAYHQRIHARGDLAPDKPDEGFVIHGGRRVSVARRGGQHGGDQRGGAPDEQRGSIRLHGSLLSWGQMRLPGSHPLRDRSGNRNGFFALAVLTLRRNSDVHPAHPALFAIAGE